MNTSSYSCAVHVLYSGVLYSTAQFLHSAYQSRDAWTFFGRALRTYSERLMPRYWHHSSFMIDSCVPD